MANKLVEFQQLNENWNCDTIQKLVTFTKKLKAKKGEDPAVPDIYKSITNICKNVVEFYPFIYKVLYQFTESQEELQKRLTIQKELVSESRKCYLLMDALSKVVPNNVEIQDFIFNMGKHGVFLHKIKTNLGEDVKQKDGEIEELKKANNDLQNDLEAKIDETNQIKANLGEDVKQKDGEIEALKKANNDLQSDLEAKIDETNQIKANLGEDVKQKDGEIEELKKANNDLQIDLDSKKETIDGLELITADATELVKQKDVEIENLKKTVSDLKKNAADNEKKEEKVARLIRQREEQIFVKEKKELKEKVERLQESMKRKTKEVEDLQLRFSTIEKECLEAAQRYSDERIKTISNAQFDKYADEVSKMLKGNANKIIEVSQSDMKRLKDQCRFKPRVQLQELKSKDTGFLEKQYANDVKNIDNELSTTKRKRKLATPVTSKKTRTI